MNLIAKLAVPVVILCACSNAGTEKGAGAASTAIPYFVDLRTVPFDVSGLEPGPHTLKFRAFAVKANSNGAYWDQGLKDKLASEIAVAKGGAAPEMVAPAVQMLDVPGHPEQLDVVVTVPLDGPGTWQVDLPNWCYDYAAMGVTAAQLGLKGPVPPPPAAMRPESLGCLGTVVLTVGACPHIAYSELISGGKGNGVDVWRVYWSEVVGGVVTQKAAVEAELLTQANKPLGLVKPEVAHEGSERYTVAVDKGAAAAYHANWKFAQSDAIAAKFLSPHGEVFSCEPAEGAAMVAVQYADGMAAWIPRVARGAIAAQVAAKSQATKVTLDAK